MIFIYSYEKVDLSLFYNTLGLESNVDIIPKHDGCAHDSL